MSQTYDGATTALQWRIEELTAELEQLRADRKAIDLHSLGLIDSLATERAAREQAEAERERIHKLWQEDEAKGIERESRLERERDTALARVKELETQGCEHVMPGFPICDRCGKSERTIAAESALASAREQIAALAVKLTIADELSESRGRLLTVPGDGLRAFDMSIAKAAAAEAAPARVAADVCGKKCDHGSECLLLRGHEGGHDTQHGCTFYDAAPVAAPCSGCAKLEVDLAFAKSQRDDNENAWQCEKQKREELQKNWDACHRQHEQCMRLLERCSKQRLPSPLGELVGQMLSKGEPGEGWDQ